MILLILVLLIIGPFHLTGNVAANGPTVMNITINPADPNIQDDVNITITLTEAATRVEIEYCLKGPGGLCFPPEDMVPQGSDAVFSFVYAAGNFENASFLFNISIHHSGGKNYFEFHLTVRAVPTSISIVDLSPLTSSPIIVFPGMDILFSGAVKNDLMEPVKGAEAVLQVRGGGGNWTSDTDDQGRFDFNISFQDNGSYILDLNIIDQQYGLSASESWELLVNSWPVPVISMDVDIDLDPSSRPSGTPEGTFFIDSEVILSYVFRNTGTGPAFNLTLNERIEGTQHKATIPVGNVSEGLRYESSIVLPTNLAGEFIYELNCSYDQIAPESLRVPAPFYRLEYVIMEKPEWKDHIVLVEMFTQSTCVPCVSMEEAIEILHSEMGDDFEFIMFELDDQVSRSYAQARGVTGTPHVFIDHGFDQILGGGEVSVLISDLRNRINMASSRITPPVSVSLLEGYGTVTFHARLSDSFDRSINGYAVIYAVESYSNQKNNQGIPLMNRFLGEVDRIPSFEMAPGEELTLDINEPPSGQDLIAVIFDIDGDVIQVKRTNRSIDPLVYLKKTSIMTDIIGNGSDVFTITVESFTHEEETTFDISFDLTVSGILSNLMMEDASGRVIGPEGLDFEFIPANKRTLEVGRIVHWMDIPLTISSKIDGEGISSFRVNMLSRGSSHSQTVVVRMRRAPVGEVSVVEYNLSAEGRSIYFTATVLNLPSGGILKGRVQPCSVDGPGGSCGMPVEVNLTRVNGSYFKAQVSGLVLDSFDYLTFKLSVIVNDEVVLETQDGKVLITDLIDIEGDMDPPDPDPTPTPYLLIASIIILLILLAAAAIVFIVLRKKSEDTDDKVNPMDEEKAVVSTDLASEIPKDDNKEHEGPIYALNDGHPEEVNGEPQKVFDHEMEHQDMDGKGPIPEE